MSVLLQVLADRLAPLFQSDCTPQEARALAANAIAAHDPQSPADYLRVARLIALSIAAISAAGQAESPDLSPPQKLRFFSAVNSLSRSAARVEAALQKTIASPASQHATKTEQVRGDGLGAMADQVMDEFCSQFPKPGRITQSAGPIPSMRQAAAALRAAAPFNR